MSRVILLVVAIFFSFIGRTQLCTGSLGDPVVNITFGNSSTPDRSFIPPAAYTFTASSCPNDGFYTITNSTSGCFGSTWHSVASDHTGGGSFMLVNASYTPGDFFVATVAGLCPNTTYEFASWVTNVLRSASGIKPDLTFTVATTTGTILNQFNTGGIAVTSSPEWKQYGFFFTTGPGNDAIILRITNNAPGGIGNDLGLDDITFRPCGPAITSSIQGNTDTLNLCIGNQASYIFNAVVSTGFVLPVYQWQRSIDSGRIWNDIAGANNLTYQRLATPAGNFWYRLTVAEAGNAGLGGCRISSNVIAINIHQKPVVNAGPDRIVISGKSIILQGSITGALPAYSWSPPDNLSDVTLLNPSASPEVDMVYKLSATSVYGCSNEDYVSVKVVAGIFVPTAFTPNNDGKNDSWKIPFLDPSLEATVAVYNRHGQLLYKSAGGNVDWNGTLNGIPQPSGTYIYTISFKNLQADMKGVLTIIR